jgi:alpha-1,2-glucosyltransferase
MTVHVAQLAYFMALCAGLHSPTSLLASLPRFPSVLRRLGWFRVCLIGLAAAFLLDRFTLSHPFLVSDNRHYTFYLWQRVFQVGMLWDVYTH